MHATPDIVSRADSEPATALGSSFFAGLRNTYARHGARIGYAVAAAVVLTGWLGREERHIRADVGLGYWLGVAGASMMVLLLLYPLRKRLRFLRNVGATSHWFRAHMSLGVLGPVLILYHCNFQLGSLNSRVALYSTLLVAISGLVGRYLYAKIHLGLYGRRANLEELVARVRLTAEQKTFAAEYVPELLDRIGEYDRVALKPPENILATAILPFTLALKTRWARFTLSRFVRRSTEATKTSKHGGEAKRQIEAVALKFISEHLRRVRRVAAFNFYERLFSLWHVFHLPFFFILVLAALAHVLAVHMY